MNPLLNPLNFDDLEPSLSNEQLAAFDEQAQASYDLCIAFATVAKSTAGKAMLKHLREMTIENATWCASLGMEKAVPHGFAREGQNALVRYIEDRVKQAEAMAKAKKNKDGTK